MLTKDEIKSLLDQCVCVGVAHNTLEGSLYFYYGILLNVTDVEVKLRTKNGYKIVPIAQILDVHLDTGRWHD